MPDLLLDSDVIIEALRGNPDTLAELAEIEAAGRLIAYTPVAKAEIYHGLRRGEEKATEGFFSACRCLTITADVGEKAGRYLAAYRKNHGTEIADALVAGAAFVHKATLFTLNRRHYPMTDISFHMRRGAP